LLVNIDELVVNRIVGNKVYIIITSVIKYDSMSINTKLVLACVLIFKSGAKLSSSYMSRIQSCTEKISSGKVVIK